jgi:bla regulator protein blaR1
VEWLVETARVLGGTLLHFLWQGALIGLLAAAALRLAARRPARDRYLICLTALFACAAAPLITAAFLIDRSPVAAVLSSISITVQAAAMAQQTVEDWLAVDFLHVVVGIWLAGVFSIATYYGLQWRGVNRVRRSAVLMAGPGHFIDTAERLLEQWNVTASVPLMVSELVSSPIVIGILRPMIVFPAATVARMPVADFELILLHEMAHIIRRDTWVNALQVLLEIVFFYHPAVHWISRRARLERECACDDFVVAESGSAYQYARALTSLAGHHHHGQPALTLGAAMGDLLPRLRNLNGECIDGDTFPRTRLQFALVGLLVGAIGIHALLDRWQHSRQAPFVRTSAEARAQEHRAARPGSAEPRKALIDSELRAAQAPSISPSASAPAPLTATADTSRVATSAAPHGATERADVSQANASGAAASLSAIAPVDTSQTSSAASSSPLPAPSIDAPQPPIAPAAIASDPPTAPDATASNSAIAPTFNPAPEYPVRARLEGIEGAVSVVVRISPDGRTKGLQIIDAQPLGVFEGNVRRALMKWRYAVPSNAASSGDLQVAYQLSFTLSGVASTPTGICATATASRTCLPR